MLGLEPPEEVELPPRNETYRIPKAVVLDEHFEKMISWDTIEYLTKRLGGTENMPHNICPLTTPGDGNCLLHALSLALWGIEKYFAATLRKLLKEELIQHKPFYSTAIDKKHEDADEQGYKDAEYQAFLKEAGAKNAHLGFIHIFALSNILRRPIVLYSSDEDMANWGTHEEGCCGLFLPTRFPSTECMGGPLALAWSTESKNHFVPLCPLEGVKIEWPLLDLVYAKSLPANETITAYLTEGAKHDKPIVETGSALSDQEVRRLREGSVRREDDARKQLLKTVMEMYQKRQAELGSVKDSFAKEGRRVRTMVIQRTLPDGRQVLQMVQLLEEEEESSDDEEEYDMLIPVKLSGDDKRYIGFNFEDKPYDVARQWLISNNIPLSHVTHIEEHIRKCVDDSRKHPEKYTQKKKLQKPKKTWDAERREDSKCPFIPYTEQMLVYSVGQIDKIVPKIVQTNEQVTPKLDGAELKELLLLGDKLIQAGTNFNQTEFNPDALDMISKMLKWPHDKVFPVIDLARVLILHRNAAIHFLESQRTVGMNDNIFVLVVSIAQAANTSFVNLFLSLKFIANLFQQSALTPLLLAYQRRILLLVQHGLGALAYSPENNLKIAETVARIMINFSALWRLYGHGKDKKEYLAARDLAVDILFKLLSQFKDKEGVVFECLVALGTILLSNASLKLRVNPNTIIGKGSDKTNQCLQFITRLLQQ